MKDMTRREFLHWTAATSTAAAFASETNVGTAAAPSPGGGSGRKPNIILILTDDQGWGDIHAHGNDRLDTPVMDALAASGAEFDRFYVCPLCAPTRATILTGRYHWRSGVNGVTHGQEIMRANETTIADVVKSAGYATACIGKWHNGSYWPYYPNARGFDEFFGFCAGHWNNYFDTTLDRNGKPVKTKGYITDVLTDELISFIRTHKDRPFFAYVPYNAPHTPYQVPDKYYDKYTARGFGPADATIYGMIENIDDNLARVLKTLDELKLAEDTVVIFLGDNGPNGRRFNGDMLGIKGSNAEGGCRVPCFVRWTGHVRPGTMIRQIAHGVDFLPTVAALAGVEHPKTLPLDGKDLTPLLLGTAKDWPDRMLFERGAVRTQRWRLQVGRTRRNRNGKTQVIPDKLYDMLADPGQKTDVAARHPDVAGKLKAAYDAWWADVSKGLVGMPPPLPVGYAEMPAVTFWAPRRTCRARCTSSRATAGPTTGCATGWTPPTASGGTSTWSRRASTGRRCSTAARPGTSARRCGWRRRRKTVEATVAKAHDPAHIPSPDRVKRKEVYEKVWATLEMGTLDLPAGVTKLTASAAMIPGSQVMELKGVRLTKLDG